MTRRYMSMLSKSGSNSKPSPFSFQRRPHCPRQSRGSRTRSNVIPLPLSRRHYLIDCATPQLYKRQKGYFKMSCPEVPNSKSALLSWSLRRRRQLGASLRSQNRRGTSRISHGIRYTPTLSCPIHSSNVVPYPGTRNSVVECSGKRAPDAI